MTRLSRWAGPAPGIVALAVIALIAGCLEGDHVTEVVPGDQEPHFALTVRLVDPSGAPVAGGTVTLAGTERSAVSDSVGEVHFTDLVGGSRVVTAAAPGRLATRLSLELPVDSPVRHFHRDMLLYPLTGRLELTVHDGRNAAPLAGATARIVAVEYAGDYRNQEPLPDWDSWTAVSDTSGHLMLENLPAARVTISLDRMDVDGDGELDLGDVTFDADLRGGASRSIAVALPEWTGDAVLEATNALNNHIVAGDPVFLQFSTPMDTELGHSIIRVYKRYSTHVPLAVEWVTDRRVVLTPGESLTDPGMLYRLEYQVVSLSGVSISGHRYFYWLYQEESTPPQGCDQVVASLSLSATQPPVDFDTREIRLRWPLVDCPGGYRLYARSAPQVNDWVELAHDPVDYPWGAEELTVTLPEDFDRFTADELVTPFAGTAVEFSVVPAEAVAPDPGPPHPVLSVADVTPPSLVSFRQEGEAVNYGATPITLTLRLEFSEFLDAAATGDPILEIVEAGGDSTYAFSPEMFEWHWLDGGRTLEGAVEILPGVNGTDDAYRVSLPAARDLAGNTSPDTLSSGWQRFPPGNAIFDFEGSAQGWTASGDCWEHGTPAVGSSPGSGGECWAVHLAGGYGNNWSCNLVSPPVRVGGYDTVLRFWTWYNTEPCCDQLNVLVNRDGQLWSVGEFQGDSDGWILRDLSLSNFAGEEVSIVFQFISNALVGGGGVYIDDVMVGVPPYRAGEVSR